MSKQYHLAQLNIAESKGSLTSSIMEGFVNRLDEINTLAENSTGFIWRYKDEEGADVPERIFNNPRLIINMSVWSDIESLKYYVYQTAHKELIKGKTAWMNKLSEAQQVMWWIPVGHIPSIQEAYDKLALIRKIGSNPEAFSFSIPYSHT